jgi:serine/threonine protein kinase
MKTELAANTEISHYRIVSMIGAGGMGAVYRAEDSRLDREVAIKVLPAEMSGDADRLQRFEREAKATSALNHPNILTVYDIGEHDGSPLSSPSCLRARTYDSVSTMGRYSSER